PAGRAEARLAAPRPAAAPRPDTLTFYLFICRLPQYAGAGESEVRPAAGHARRAHPQDHRARARSRLRRVAAPAADLARRAAGAARIAVPRAASPRETRLGPRRVGGVGNRPRRALLHADPRRAPPARGPA